MPSVSVATFYAFRPLRDLPALRADLLALGRALGVSGTVLLAEEGINATLAVRSGSVEPLLDGIRRLIDHPPLTARISASAGDPFLRFKVRIKPEIVTFGVPGTDPLRRTGTRVAPVAWNAILRDPAIPVIDVRNSFECALGTFEGAIDPGTASFGAFPDFAGRHLDAARDKAVAMFCTGGIRCEKASAYLLEQGFETVYQLDGGILAYLEQVPAGDSLWSGECFVFDGRVALGPSLTVGEAQLCHACRRPVTAEDRRHASFVDGVSCPACASERDGSRRLRAAERQKQVNIATARGRRHLGPDAQA